MFHKFVDGIVDLQPVRSISLGENVTDFLDENGDIVYKLERRISPEELDAVYANMESSRAHISGHTLISRSVMKSIAGVVEVRLSHKRSILVFSNGEEVDAGCHLPTAIVDKIYEINREIKKKSTGERVQNRGGKK